MCLLDAETCIDMFVILLFVKGMPAHESELGPATWLYNVQQFSPITQLAPHLLVSGVAVAVLVAMHVVYGVSIDVWLAMTNRSVRASGEPFPRILSLKNAVLLRPSVTLAGRMALRKKKAPPFTSLGATSPAPAGAVPRSHSQLP